MDGYCAKRRFDIRFGHKATSPGPFEPEEPWGYDK